MCACVRACVCVVQFGSVGEEKRVNVAWHAATTACGPLPQSGRGRPTGGEARGRGGGCDERGGDLGPVGRRQGGAGDDGVRGALCDVAVVELAEGLAAALAAQQLVVILHATTNTTGGRGRGGARGERGEA